MVREIRFDTEVDMAAMQSADDCELIPLACSDCGRDFYSELDGGTDPHPTPVNGVRWICESCFDDRKVEAEAQSHLRRLIGGGKRLTPPARRALDDLRMVLQ